MIRNPREAERTKREHERKHPLTHEQKYAILNAMYEEVRQLGRFKLRTTGDRMKHKLEMARLLNAGVAFG